MVAWDEFDKEEESYKDDEEANLTLMDLTSSDTKSESYSGSDSEEEDVTFPKLYHSNLINLVKDLMDHCQDKARHIKFYKSNMR